MYFKDDLVHFYGAIAGNIAEGVIYMKEHFRCGESLHVLDEWKRDFGYTVVWQENV